MYFDLFLPFPSPRETLGEPSSSKKKKDKGKGRAQPSEPSSSTLTLKSCWDGIDIEDKEGFSKNVALSGHLGYNVIGCTIPIEPSSHAPDCPFRAHLPFPILDPRNTSSQMGSSGGGGGGGGRGGPSMVQVSRLHMRLDDSKVHCFTGGNTNTLKDWDLLSVLVTSDKALQLACTELANPGPNQISIISLPLHERPYHFRLNRKQIRQAQRLGVVFEILYSAALFPPSSVSAETARRYRQNWMTNAKEVVRVTGGKGVIFSSGPGGSAEGLRGPQDVVNLATILGMPANLAKDAVSQNPKMVLLKAQARRTYKAVLSMPKLVPAPGQPLPAPNVIENGKVSPKRPAENSAPPMSKKVKVA
ncbi:RNase P subunit p30-domain-containing protein [Naematelia encephala]|uniref:RNase P subunit p30-domain-containing protein n=1 Tax=Naematelia encephala TaxID=71784 RepID=A0A1Y2BG44_9TREE|nr:RNase P subunit p30-domain-containing protein [Naematelia encephala]